MSERRPLQIVILLAAFCNSGVVSAQDDAGVQAASSFSAIDTLWVLLAAFLVFFMQAGFGMVEAGFVRAKNSANVLMKNVLDFCMAALGYFMFGYAIMYGVGNGLVGTTGWFMIGAESGADGIPVEAYWLFQAMFAGAAATIVAGAVAERMRFVSYLVYSFIISAFIYPVVGHWVWGGGWLADLNFHDFAGSTVVHSVGGVSALVGAWMLGPRFGRFRKDGTPRYIGGHSLPLATIGVFILWFGWYGFNAGSTLGFSEPGVVARVALNTTLAPSMGAIVAMALAWRMYGKPDLTLALNGALGGLVGITAPCAVVSSGAAFLIGGVAGALVVLCVGWLNRLRIDDVVGAFPVHGLAGIWGTLAVGLFGQKALSAPMDGLFMGGGVKALGVQALGVGVCVAFTAVTMGLVFKLIKMTVGLRVSHETELRGLDRDEHGLDSYAGFQIFHTD